MEPARKAVAQMTETPVDGDGNQDMLVRVGQMTRSLHDSLRGLGFDKLIARAAHDIPDARDRLDYVARMTEQAAQKVLNATEAAGPLQEQIERSAQQLEVDWQRALDTGAATPQQAALMQQTIEFMQRTQTDAQATRQHLLAIMMAQDFQDLTGQVIKKITELAHGIEQQLVQLLLDYAPPDVRREVDPGLMNGPQINQNGGTEIVSNQGQVDDLLDSLGF